MSNHQQYRHPLKTYLSVLLFTLISQSFSLLVMAEEAHTSGEMELITSEDNQQSVRLALLLDSEATINISGMVAMVELTQHFKNDSDHWVEGRYVFPLPENSAVDSMELRIGNRIIRGKIKEKQQAKEIYAAAKKAGKKTALLEQHRPNLFSQQVANIAPREKITVKLRYLQTIHYEQGVFSLRFPMTITPRYIPQPIDDTHLTNSESIREYHPAQPITIQNNGWGQVQPNNIVNDAHLITPPIDQTIDNPITLNITLDAGLPLASITSPYHDIVINKSHDQHHITSTQGRISMDRDFVLNWQATASSTPRAAVFNETIEGEDYSLVMLMPPTPHNNNDNTNNKNKGSRNLGSQNIAKEMIFIIDTSGSMGGTSIRQAKAGLQKALQQLKPTDRFNVIEFNSNFSMMHYQPVTASPNNIKNATDIVSRFQAGGGTEMLSALTAAFQQSHKDTHFKQIIFITDGSISNEEQLIRNIQDNLNDSRLFTVGIGSAPNSFFMRKAAEIGRGTFTYIGDINEVDKKMTALFTKISQPTMRDISIHDSSFFNSSEKSDNKNTNSLDIFPNPIADLYQGQPLIATIHKDYELSELTIKGTYQNQAWQQKLALSNGKQSTGVAKLWARNKIESLLGKERQEKRNSSSLTVLQLVKKDIIDVALQHQLMSPYTSFVAVEEEISKPIDQNATPLEVANKLAHGQTMNSVSYPKTATPLWSHILLGSLSLLASLMMIYCKGRRHQWSHHAL